MSDQIEKVKSLFNCKDDTIKEFEIIDTFNNNHVLYGFMCRQPGQYYGSMLITKVNDEMCEQIVYATPKLQYPFDKNGNFHWPEVSQVQIWEKLDGTNILAFHYNYKGKQFLTFKTRLGPVVSNHVYGEFANMWNELLQTKTWIIGMINKNKDYNLSFELFGSRNPILIKYDVLLDTRLLFGVNRVTGEIVPPRSLNICDNTNNCFPLFREINSLKKLTEHYNLVRADLSEENKDVLLHEGAVYYALTVDEQWRMYKCKPEEIEKIHWSASGIIPKNSIRATIVNSFEDAEPDLEYILTLLREEYNENLIIKSMVRIKKILDEVQENVKTQKKVNSFYQKALDAGFNITVDKAATMRFLSQYFIKSEMRKVAAMLLNK